MSNTDSTSIIESLQPGTYSVWAYDRQDEGPPILISAYSWEMAGLRGIKAVQQWSPVFDGRMSEQDTNLTSDLKCCDPEGIDSLDFVRLVADGTLQLIGEMPPIGEYAKPPSYMTRGGE